MCQESTNLIKKYMYLYMPFLFYRLCSDTALIYPVIIFL